jgi:hypothetical protein
MLISSPPQAAPHLPPWVQGRGVHAGRTHLILWEEARPGVLAVDRAHRSSEGAVEVAEVRVVCTHTRGQTAICKTRVPCVDAFQM